MRWNTHPCRDHLGNEYPSERAMCAAYHVKNSTYRMRLARGSAPEQALTTPTARNDPRPFICDGESYKSLGALCAATGACPSTVRRRLAQGMPIEKAVEKGRVKDPVGRLYPDAKAMCAEWHVPYGTYRGKLRNDPGEAISLACIAAWPGKSADPHRIIKCVSFPWFLCTDDSGNNAVIRADELRKLM